MRYLSSGGIPASKPKAKTTFLDADDDRSEALSVHELVSLLMLYLVAPSLLLSLYYQDGILYLTNIPDSRIEW